MRNENMADFAPSDFISRHLKLGTLPTINKKKIIGRL